MTTLELRHSNAVFQARTGRRFVSINDVFGEGHDVAVEHREPTPEEHRAISRMPEVPCTTREVISARWSGLISGVVTALLVGVIALVVAAHSGGCDPEPVSDEHECLDDETDCLISDALRR